MATDELEWIIPASIPFEDLKAKDLEECVYWLLDAMGAQDIEWRVGGAGGGASDGGRDLEAKILVPSEDGDLSPRTWWFECKGRARTVEPEAVKYAVVNAAAFGHIDTVVVVTNTNFSNPTLDWVKSWNSSHSHPQVQLWDRSKLEQLISRQPSVVLRLFTECLSVSGRLQALSSRFWNRLEYVPSKVLEDLWENRSSLSLDALNRFALIANECANRSLEARPWGAVAEPSEVLETLYTALANVFFLMSRSISSGVNQAPIFKSLNYLLLLSLRHASPEDVARLVQIFVCERDGVPLPDNIIEIFLKPVLGNLFAELSDICVPHCSRVSRLRKGEMTSDGDNLSTYWYRFDANGLPSEEENNIAWLESYASRCEVGFPVSDVCRCPLITLDPIPANLSKMLDVAQRVLNHHLARDLTKRGRT